MDILEAMKSSFLLGQSEKYDEAAKLLREDIINSCKDGEEIHWPITVNDLNCISVVPVQLERFLTSLLSEECRPIQGNT